MKQIDVLIIYEIVNRELESASLLKKFLEEKGMTVEIVSYFWDMNTAYIRYSPKMVIVPWAYDDFDYRNFSRFKGGLPNNQLNIVNLHSEQLCSTNDTDLLLPAGKTRDFYHFTWGEYYKKVLTDAGIEENKIFVSGSQRLDFFKERFKAISKSRDELSQNFNIDKNKKWVLIIGNFNDDLVYKKRLEGYAERGSKDIYKLADITGYSYYESIKWYDYVLEKVESSGNYEFIYRPHPSESVSKEITALEERYSNFHVIREYAIRDWIVNSSIAFSWNSTAAIEAVAASLPIFYLHPRKIFKEMEIPLIDSVERLYSKEEFLEVLCNYETMKCNEKIKERMSYYYYEGKESAAELISGFIEKHIDETSEAFASRYNFLYSLFRTIKYAGKLFLYKTNLMSGKSIMGVRKSNYLPQKDKEKIQMAVNKI